MQSDILLAGRENIRTARLQRLADGSKWICCPYCGKKSFPVVPETEIHELYIRCRASFCKQLYRIDLRPIAAHKEERQEGGANG